MSSSIVQEINCTIELFYLIILGFHRLLREEKGGEEGGRRGREKREGEEGGRRGRRRGREKREGGGRRRGEVFYHSPLESPATSCPLMSPRRNAILPEDIFSN